MSSQGLGTTAVVDGENRVLGDVHRRRPAHLDREVDVHRTPSAR
ncbi:MAG: hypothetical protein U5L11_00075 [Arhodomonas sp.]|nr:hypothetical protein [Arhodomonas sp.]